MTKHKNHSLSYVLLLLLPLTVFAADPPPAAPAIASQAVHDDYVIGPGDTIQVYVFRNPELTVTLPVRPDGKISTPLVEDMVAVGKTPSVLARDIEKALSQYVRTPQVNVIVTQPQSAFSQVKVVGQVQHPQSLPFREGMKVLDVILASGGLSEFAAGNRAVLDRVVDGREEKIKLKIDKLVNHGDMSQNLPLRPGDTLFIPQSRF
jgi:polysaccharide biosynthesis/export protein